MRTQVPGPSTDTVPPDEHLRAELLAEALRLRFDERLSIIPVVGKRPARRTWKRFQDHLPTESRITKDFSNPSVTGIAVIGCSVSGDLVIRDFDDPDTHDRWAQANPEVAARVPRVQSRRGFHVYFRCLESVRTFRTEGGEVRSNGGYTVAPPSWHSEDYFYKALQPISDIPVFRTLADAGIAGPAICTSGTTKSPRTNQSDLDIGRRVIGVNSIDEAIRAFQPRRVGERYHLIGALARFIKVNLGASDLSSSEVHEIATRWHSAAYAVIGTKPLAETVRDFANWYGSARFGVGGFKRSVRDMVSIDQSPSPYSGTAELVWRTCRAAQRYRGDGKFFCSTRVFAEIFPLSHQTAARYLRLLIADGWLVEAEPDERASGKRVAPCFTMVNPETGRSI